MAGITWNVKIHGHKHRVVCKPEINRYIFYVDDNHLTNVYRDELKGHHYGAEKTIRICGQDCQFVLWNEYPDLVVDGMLQGRGAPYQEAKQKRRRNRIRMHRILQAFFLTVFLVLLVYMLRVPLETEALANCITTCASIWTLFFHSGYKILRWRAW